MWFPPGFQPPPPPPPAFKRGRHKISDGRTVVIVEVRSNEEYTCRWLGDTGLWTASKTWLEKNGARFVETR